LAHFNSILVFLLLDRQHPLHISLLGRIDVRTTHKLTVSSHMLPSKCSVKYVL
jgi:hypothetical protein